ncbi:hypothetical protein GPA10_05065 [Streptomyces sp. p1417]|uniref:Uncharacterized protein n=1 Tax=Streptomyces typhae TaxID=2681492 RepID=A0A6L6WUX1_9ACTN|nr:hypothetical protein [Streptomyces typhae]MVO84156.1 hypothetical protein [Streptomyces typhae]
MTARRCVRGHFIPTTAPTNACRCVLIPGYLRRHHFSGDTAGQGRGIYEKGVVTTWAHRSYL